MTHTDVQRMQDGRLKRIVIEVSYTLYEMIQAERLKIIDLPTMREGREKNTYWYKQLKKEIEEMP